MNKRDMIKGFYALLLAMALGVTMAHAMMPGRTVEVECPLCGCAKSITTLLSGNTFGSRHWSDTKSYSPGMPRLPYVWKCDGCHKYYIPGKDAPRVGFGAKDLSYDELKEAYVQLSDSGMDERRELSVRLELVKGFNDRYRIGRRGGKRVEPSDQSEDYSDEEKAFAKDNLLRTIALLCRQEKPSIPVIAEFFREAGDYGSCLRMLDSYLPEDDYLDYIAMLIRQHANEQDSKVFEIPKNWESDYKKRKNATKDTSPSDKENPK